MKSTSVAEQLSFYEVQSSELEKSSVSAGQRADILRRMVNRKRPLLESPEDGSTSVSPRDGKDTGARATQIQFTLSLPSFSTAEQVMRGSFALLQEWEGVVLAVGADAFSARLIDLTARTALREEDADFPINDLSDDDRRRLKPGAVFRWAIGYYRSPGGTKSRASQIVFRRLPMWTSSEIERARKEAEELSARIAWV